MFCIFSTWCDQIVSRLNAYLCSSSTNDDNNPSPSNQCCPLQSSLLRIWTVSPVITPLFTALCERYCLKCGKCVAWLPLNYDESFNLLPFQSICGFGRRKTSLGAKCGEYGQCEMTLLLVRNSCKDKAQKADALSQCRNQSQELYFSSKWDSQHVNNFMDIILLVLSTSSFIRCTFLSVLLANNVLNVQQLQHR